MIKKFIVKNYLNEILELELTNPDESGFIVQEVTGLGPDKSNLNIKEVANNDGGYFNSARTPVKNIVMNLLFVGTPLIEDTRHKSYRYFPMKKPLTLTIVTDRHTLNIDGYVESNEPNIFSDQEGCQISILCPSPYFTSGKKQIVQSSGEKPLFEFPFSNELVPDPYVTITEEIEIPGSTTFMYNLPDNDVNLYYRYTGGAVNKYDKRGYFPFKGSIDMVNNYVYNYLPFNWLKNVFFGDLSNLSDDTYFIMYFSLDMHIYYNGSYYDGSKTISLISPTYYAKDSNDAIEIELLDKDGSEIDLSEYTLTISGFNKDKSMEGKELSIKFTKDMINNIEKIRFNVNGGHYAQNIQEGGVYTYSAYARIYNVKFYREIPSHVIENTETKLRIEDCLVDETMPDYQFEQDGKEYNLRVSEGMVFGEFNNYQFDHVVSYEGTKDVGFIMTIEFEHSLSIDASKGAGYLVITDIRYSGQSMIIDFNKIEELINEATGNILDSDEGSSGPTTGIPPILGGYFESPPAQKGDILTIDTRTGHKNVYYQRPGDWNWGNYRFNVLGAINQNAFWFSISQGENVFQIRHTFHADNDELQPSDKDLVHANFLMVQTENDVFYEGV